MHYNTFFRDIFLSTWKVNLVARPHEPFVPDWVLFNNVQEWPNFNLSLNPPPKRLDSSLSLFRQAGAIGAKWILKISQYWAHLGSSQFPVTKQDIPQFNNLIRARLGVQLGPYLVQTSCVTWEVKTNYRVEMLPTEISHSCYHYCSCW